MTDNQNPEQKARDKIDALLKQAGWKVQDKKKIDLNDGPGQAVREFQPISELTALVALIRRVCGMDKKLSTFDDTVRRNFQCWVLKHHSGGGEKFNEEQMNWLRMIRDHVASSIHMERDDLEMAPFDGQGGLGRMHQLFGAKMDALLDELNEVLAA